MTDVNWLTVVFDGSAGAVIGTLGAFGAALLVVKRQSRADRALARGERRRATCIELLRAARDFKRDINTMPNLAEDITAFELRVQAIEDGLWANEPYAKELGGPVAAAFEDLYNAVDIWDDMLVMRGGRGTGLLRRRYRHHVGPRSTACEFARLSGLNVCGRESSTPRSPTERRSRTR
jgi:hypothetical protein